MIMTYTEELTKRRLDDRYKIIKEQTVIKVLRYLLLKNNIEQFDQLNDLLPFRKQLIESIESDHRWTYTVDGFLNISDHAFDGNQMTFIANFIPRDIDGFYVDDTCTEKAHSHFSYHHTIIEELSRVDRIIYNMYLENKKKIDQFMVHCTSIEDIEKINERIRQYFHLQPTEPPKSTSNEDRARGQSSFVETFYTTYGERGMSSLLRWSKECNGHKSSEVLLAELTDELKPISSTGKYSEEFYDERFLRALSLYSVRGDYLRDQYLTQKRKNEEMDTGSGPKF